MAGELQIEYQRVEALVPWARNARTHSEEQIATLAASIQEFGWTNPVLVNGDEIMAGHGRVLAALKLGFEEIPCIELAGMTDVQKAGTAMRYIGLVLEGTKKAPTARAGAERNQSTSSA